MSDFIWTDELVEEFAKQYRFSSSRISIEMFKEGKGFPVAPSNDEDELWRETIKICNEFIVDVGNHTTILVVGGMAINELKSKFSITRNK